MKPTVPVVSVEVGTPPEICCGRGWGSSKRQEPQPSTPRKAYRRPNSFTAEELATIWKVRHLPTKDVLDLFPRRSPAIIDYLRQKTGAYRVGYYKEEKCSTST